MKGANKHGTDNKENDIKGNICFIHRIFYSSNGFGRRGSVIPYKAKWFIWVYQNASGNIVIVPKYSDASWFSENFAVVKIGRKWGYIDPKDKIIIKPQYDLALPFSEGLASVKLIINGVILIRMER